MIRQWLRRIRRRRGTGLIVVLVLVAVMSVYVIANAVALRSLQKRLNLLETRHRQRWSRSEQPKPTAGTPIK